MTNALTVMHLLNTYAQITHASNLWCHSFPVLHNTDNFPHNAVCSMGNWAFCLAFCFLWLSLGLKYYITSDLNWRKSWYIHYILLVHPAIPSHSALVLVGVLWNVVIVMFHGECPRCKLTLIAFKGSSKKSLLYCLFFYYTVSIPVMSYYFWTLFPAFCGYRNQENLILACFPSLSLANLPILMLLSKVNLQFTHNRAAWKHAKVLSSCGT